MEKEIYNNIINDLKQSLSFEELHQKYGYSIPYLKKKLKDDGYFTPNNVKPYSDEEINIIKENYYLHDIKEFMYLLPGHSYNSIMMKAMQLGLKKEDPNSLEHVKRMIQNKSYTIIEENFDSTSNGFDVVLDGGYKAYVTKSSIYSGGTPKPFCVSNPYTLDNIKFYIEKNNINIKLLSTEYLGDREPMEWKCECGNTFIMTFKQFLHGKHTCNECSRKKRDKDHRIDLNYINNILNNDGYKIINIDISKPVSHNKFDIEDLKGYRYSLDWNRYINSNEKPLIFSLYNPFSIYNINKYLEINNKEDYKCISKEYKGKFSPISICHTTCGHVFQTTWEFIRKYNNLFCPECYPKKRESNHASILKQIFLHEYPDTQVEEPSCINPNTGRIMPTDIVNHKLKIVVEIQSDYHDKEKNKERDAIKKQFWINKGYSYYAPDIRDYSILEMIQIFFPNIKGIPNYINYNFSDCYDYTIVQDYLDKGYLIKEISEKTGIKIGAIHGMVQDKKIVLPDGYWDKAHHIRSVVQLDNDGNLIRRYSKITDAKKFGHKASGIYSALGGKLKTYHQYIWKYEEDYLLENKNLND